MSQVILCYIPKVMEIGPLIAKKKIFKVLYRIRVWKPSGQVTSIIVMTYFHFLVPKSLHIKFGQKCQVLSEKNKILF